MRKGVRIAVALLTLALPAAAGAESISYVEGGNVFISTPDGARRVQITTGGSSPSNEYTLAGTADNGKVQTAFGNPSTWFSFNPDGTGTGEQPNLVPMKQCGAAFGSFGPLDPRLHPDGNIVAFTYFCNYADSSHEIDMGVDLPKVYTPSTSATAMTGFSFPSFFGKRLIVQDTNILIQEDNANDPFHDVFNDWVLPDPGENLTRAEVARSGGRMVIDETLNGTKQMIIGTFANIGEFTAVCTISAGAPADGTFSPEGTKLAWTDSGGLHVGQLDLGRSDCIVPGSVKTLSATGSSPRWSAYTIPEPVQTPPPTPTPNPNPTQNTQPTTQTTTPAAATLSVAVAAAAKLKQLVKGLVVGYDVNAAGVVEAALSQGRVRLAFARKTVAAPGKGKLTLKLTKKAKKRAKRLKGKTLTLRTTFTPKAGTPVVAVKKLRIR